MTPPPSAPTAPACAQSVARINERVNRARSANNLKLGVKEVPLGKMPVVAGGRW